MDGKVPIEEFIGNLIHKGFDGMLVSDHNSYNGYRKWKRTIKDKKYKDFVVLKGIEYDTIDAGHILVIMPETIKLKILELRGLPVQIYLDPACLRVKTPVRFRISDLLNDPPGKTGIVHLRLRGDFAENMYRVGGAGHLAGNPGLGILFQQGVQDSVRDLIADLVRMAAGDGFGGKIVSVHNILPRVTASSFSKPGGIPPDNDKFTPFFPK